MAKVGRPTKWTDNTVEKAEEYLKTYDSAIPSAAGLAIHLGVVKDTLYEWAKVHPEFSVMLKKLNQNQEFKLLNGGLTGDMNATIAKLVLAKHNYSDRVETKNETKLAVDVSNMTDDQLKAIINGKG